MSHVLITAPEVEPLATADLLDHVRELDPAQGDYLDSLALVARQTVEEITRRALITQTWRLLLDGFPEDRDFLRLPRPPLQAVTSIKYIDGGGTQVTWDPSAYVVDPDSTPGRVHLAYGVSWPSTREQPNAVEVIYTAGYGDDPSDVPDGIKHAMRLLVGNWYEHREPVVTGTTATRLPLSVDALLGLYRVREF